MNLRTGEPSDVWTFGLVNLRTGAPSDYWADTGPTLMDAIVAGLSKEYHFKERLHLLVITGRQKAVGYLIWKL